MDPGVVLGGKYRLERPIGKGGMGEVWRARRLDLDVDVAVKVMTLVAAEHEAAFARFQREARAAAGLRSPHVVQIFDFGRDEVTGTPFIAMELLDGESLRERLAREKVLAADVVCEIVVQIGRALARAHAAQIVHRDLKPDNVFLVTNEDQVLVKLLDFGIAKAEPRPGEALPTATGVLLGTPYYMSPEQLQSSRGVDGRTDLWSLCVIAYECLTGVKPFKAATLPELAMKIALGRAAPPSHLAEVPVGFDEWFARGIEVEPERRFQSATELIEALREVVREPRRVGGAPPERRLEVTQDPDTDSLSSQVAATRTAADAPGSAAALPARPGRSRLYAGAALALVMALGTYRWLGWINAPPAPAAAGAEIPAVAAPAAVALPLEPVSTAPAAPVEAAPSVVNEEQGKASAKGGEASSARDEASGKSAAVKARRAEARERAPRRPESRPRAASAASASAASASAAAAPSATPAKPSPAIASPANASPGSAEPASRPAPVRRVDAFDQQ